jgi:hypothetical protein
LITLTFLAVLAVGVLTALGRLPWPSAIADRAAAGSAQTPQVGVNAQGEDNAPETPGAASDNAAAAPGLPSMTFGRWQYPNALGPVLGTAGSLLRYRVAVQQTLPVTVAEFTDLVDSTLGDSRSWIAGRDVRLQRVPPASAHDFTIYLATPATADELCSQGGLDIRENGVPYTSCRTGDLVVINADRYLNAVPDYGAPLVEYRHYMINHEVGHRLGHGHELCPAAGQPAPVMEQQTLGLQGCVANSWPYVNGRRYSGAPTA